jgi:hypothetical protein
VDEDGGLAAKAILSKLQEISVVDAEKAIRKTSSCKCSPDDVFPTWLIKTWPSFCHLLCRLCNESFRSGVFPDGLKQAVITPILKKNDLDSDEPSNYRPVSNLKLISKLVESFAANQLSLHLLEVTALHHNQSAYRRHFSTETALLKVVSEWWTHLDKGEIVCVASLDVSAAFDTVDHGIMETRLIQAGVLGKALRWFKSYLGNRTATVRCGDSRSDMINLPSGVPQGSVLGPTLFNLYMSDLCRLLETTCPGIQFHIYADDILLYIHCSPSKLSAATAALQAALRCVEKWMLSNRLLLNPHKTNLLILRRPKVCLPVVPHLITGGTQLQFSTSGSLKWLGVQIDVNLTLDDFINQTCRSCFAILRMMRHIRPIIGKHHALLLSNALVLSRIDYCNSLLGGLNRSSVSKLQRVINLAARIVARKPRHEHITPILEQLDWLRVEKRIQKKIAILVFKSLSGAAPAYISTSISVHVPRRSLRSSTASSSLLELGSARTKAGKCSWSVSGPAVWNSLPENVREKGISFDVFLTLLCRFLSIEGYSGNSLVLRSHPSYNSPSLFS